MLGVDIMKLIIDKKVRLVIISVISLFLVLVSFLILKNIRNPGLKEEKKALYNYKNNTSMDFRVALKPNALYNDGTTLGEGNIFFSELIDSIKTNFKYQFEGERAAYIKGDYEIVALVEGFTGADKEQKVIWKKSFPIAPKESFEAKDKSISIEKEIGVNLEQYKSFAQSVSSSTRVEAQTRLSVIMNINLKAVTDKGIIDKKLAPSISIPLNANYFEVTKNQAQGKGEAIEETKEVKIPVNKKMVVSYSVILGILLAALVYAIFFTAGEESIDSHEKELKSIFKNHGDRMVALSDYIAFSSERYYSVWSIEDLVKISDEIGRPIMYKFSEDIRAIKQFYVCDDKSTYVFDIGEKIIKTVASGIDSMDNIKA